MLNKGTVLSDRYEIIERIGVGGMADVYRAMDHKLNRYVAIKVLKREFREDKQFIAKFKQEARSVAGLSHPNIVNVYDVGNENSMQYIVLELVEGITLKKYIEKKGHLPYKEAVSISIQVANGIEAAHAHHIVHRDIKPQNIIISREGKVKVMDFGIAKAKVSSNTVTTSVMGSVHYMSPEQARGGYADERSDIYSFGITIFEMLTGTVPFDGDTTVAVAVHHIQDDIQAPSTMMEGIPISVDKIVQKCTRKKVDARYQNMEELIADLKKSLIYPDEDFVDKTTPPVERKVEEISKKSDVESEGNATTDISNDKGKFSRPLKWIIIGIIAAAAITATVVGVNAVSKSNAEKATEATLAEVPNVTGNTVADAIESLKAAGFKYLVSSDSGVVISQDPAGGTKANKGSTVTLTLNSDTKATEEVPKVEGLTEAEAISAIQAKDFAYAVTTEKSTTVEKGKVIRTTPAAGEKVEKGKTITIVVSSGKEDQGKVPDVTGKTYAEATELINNAGYSYWWRRTEGEDVEPEDDEVVVRQDPSKDTELEEGERVVIYFNAAKTTGTTTATTTKKPAE